MTKEEALQVLSDRGRVGVHIINANDEETIKYNSDSIEALKMAIKALEQQRKFEQLLELYQDALTHLCERQRNNINDSITDAMFSGKLSVYGIIVRDLKGLLERGDRE